MADLSGFCTCKDLECPFHPTNHDKGCSLCIEKNLRLGEVPSCFFNKVGGTEGKKSFTFKDFAEAVLSE